MNSAASAHETFDLDAPIIPRADSSEAPLADRQEDWWNVTSKDGRAINTRLRAASVRILGPLNLSVFRASVLHLSTRHESLRTRVLLRERGPVQIVDSPKPDAVEIIDLQHTSAITVDACARAHAREFFAQKVDLSTGPLLAIQLLILGPTSHVLLIGLEHVVADGTSCAILSRELWATYHQLAAGARDVTLPPLPIQVADYARWHHDHLTQLKQRHERFWTERMNGSPQIALPQRHSRAIADNAQGEIIHLPFGKSITEGLRTTARREKTLAPLLFLSVWVLALSRWCEQDDFVAIVAHHGRYRRLELDNIIGYLAKALYFRITVRPTETLSDFVARIHAEFVAVTSNEAFTPPFPKDCNLSFLFNWGGLSTYSARWSLDQQRRAEPTLRIQPFDFPEATSATFFPFFSETPSGAVLTVYYRPDLVARESLERLARNLRHYARALIDDGNTSVGALTFID